jgi:hypothetical protein
MQQLLSKGRIPKKHRDLLEQNLARLEDEVSGGGPASRYWEFATPPALGRRTLVPRTDMPIDGYLPPSIRTPENITALEGAIGNAEAIGEGLRSRLPWAPIALQLSLLGSVSGALVGGTARPAEAADGSVTLAAAPIAGGAAAGAALGGGIGVAVASALRAAKSARGFLRRKAINPDIAPMVDEDDFVKMALEDQRRTFLLRATGSRQNWESMPGTQGIEYLGDKPIGRLYNDFYESISAVSSYMAGAARGASKPGNIIVSTNVPIPKDLFDLNGPSFSTFIDGFLVRAFNGGRAGNVVYNAMGNGTILNGNALKNKYVVSQVTDDLIDPVQFSYSEFNILSAEGRRRFLRDFQKTLPELGASVQDEPRGVFYAFNTDDPSYLGAFEFDGSSIFGTQNIDPWALTGSLRNEARELVIMAGTLADSADEAFQLAAQRGQLFVKEALTGKNVRVPKSYLGQPIDLGRVTVPPSPAGRNVAENIDRMLDGTASQYYQGRGEADEVLTTIYKEQGFDKPTLLVSDAEAEILVRDHGFFPLYRGIEFEAILESQVPDIENQILNSKVWREEILPRITSEAETRSMLNSIVSSREEYLYGFQDDVMNLWVSRNEPLFASQDFGKLLSDLTKISSYTPSYRASTVGDDFAKKIFGSATVDDALIPENFVRDFALGEHFAGSGSHGNGTYTTPNLQRAMGYAGIDDEIGMVSEAKGGVVLGALLKPDARIMGPTEYNSFVKALQHWPAHLGFKDVGDKLKRSPWGDEFSKLFDVLDLEPDVFEYSLRGSFADIGRAIAAIGYDGYIPHGTVYGYQKPEYVLLNRQSFVVINHPIEPITITPFSGVEAFSSYPKVEVQ